VTVSRVERQIGSSVLSIETGKLAKQAHGAVVVSYRDTSVLVTAVEGSPLEGRDFFPLTVDYREKTYAAGKFPGGFIKREGRPTTKEILTSRLIDRPIRPLFPDGYLNEVQIMASVLSADGENDPDVLAMIGASAALHVSHIPFRGPTGAIRIGRRGGEYLILPTLTELEESDLDLVVSGTRDNVIMIEGFARELPEEDMVRAIMYAQSLVVEICDMIADLRRLRGLGPLEWQEPEPNPLIPIFRERFYQDLRERKLTPGKQERAERVRELKEKILEEFVPPDAPQPQYTPAQVNAAFDDLERRVVRDLILEGKRVDGRGWRDLRPIHCEVGILARTHGSALFQRGETQALVTTVLGTAEDEQIVDGIVEEYSKKFMLEYNFPPFCVGECRPIRGPGRREIGHGALAERSLAAVIPPPERFPYTIRVVSDILESNGSSSMASVCGATLSLMDAGVPIREPVAGISIGLLQEPDRYILLTDIVGDEDHFGDMDFKVAGTGRGITGIQLDLKIAGISEEIIRDTLEQAREARIRILRIMLETLRAPRADISKYAPRLVHIKIHPEKIGLLIGPGGKTIRSIQDQTGAKIDIADDGTVTIASSDARAVEMARAKVEAITDEIRVGKIYEGRVTSIKEFGAFVEIAPGRDGLVHISELDDKYVSRVEDVVKIGDKIEVKVIAIDSQDRVKLSRKAVLREAAGGGAGGEKERPPSAGHERERERGTPERGHPPERGPSGRKPQRESRGEHRENRGGNR
jgi:polyribonucleotide nucleotidyltransferase